MKEITILLLGVATLISGKAVSQSEGSIFHGEPIRAAENFTNPQGLNNPEVVLQLKYDRGALDRIYLAQFRQAKASWVPSVPARTNLCSDLCHAGFVFLFFFYFLFLVIKLYSVFLFVLLL